MTSSLQPQLKNSSEIKKILKEINTCFTLHDGRTVNTLLVYLPCREDNKSSHKEFFECIKNGILQNFVFSCREIEKKLGLNAKAGMDILFDKALRKLSKQTAQGELGELILFTLLDVYLCAPKLLSKVANKTSPKMPVFGADAVHGRFLNNKFQLFLGESKLYENFKAAATDASNSIVNAKDNFDIEFDLLDSDMNFPDYNSELESEIIDFLNPYTNEKFLDYIYSPCFIGFTQPDIIVKDESDYIEKYTNLSCDYIGHFFSKIEKKGLDINKVTLLMLPFGCVDTLVKEFIEYIGIKK